MGKNKKPKSIGRLLIDLTPLLDVIFIVLIVVLAGRDTFNANVEQKYAEAEQVQSEAEQKQIEAEQEINDMMASVKTYESQLEVFEELNDQFNVIAVSTYYKLQDRTYRNVIVKTFGNEPVAMELNPSNSDKVWDQFKTIIEDVVKADETKETIISLKIEEGEKTLYRDYEKMKNIINELQGIYPGKISVKE
ncbi:MAG: hypothetical protein IK014_02095 [Lachnospiraceae bacterium]|nr:hypothetical protein [Lachnospiraceae bacterium]